MTKAGEIKIRTFRQHSCSSVSSPPIGSLFCNPTFISIILCGALPSPISFCGNQFFLKPQSHRQRNTEHDSYLYGLFVLLQWPGTSWLGPSRVLPQHMLAQQLQLTAPFSQSLRHLLCSHLSEGEKQGEGHHQGWDRAPSSSLETKGNHLNIYLSLETQSALQTSWAVTAPGHSHPLSAALPSLLTSKARPLTYRGTNSSISLSPLRALLFAYQKAGPPTSASHCGTAQNSLCSAAPWCSEPAAAPEFQHRAPWSDGSGH